MSDTELLIRVYEEVITESGVGKTIGWAAVTGKWCWSFVFRRA